MIYASPFSNFITSVHSSPHSYDISIFSYRPDFLKISIILWPLLGVIDQLLCNGDPFPILLHFHLRPLLKRLVLGRVLQSTSFRLLRLLDCPNDLTSGKFQNLANLSWQIHHGLLQKKSYLLNEQKHHENSKQNPWGLPFLPPFKLFSFF